MNKFTLKIHLLQEQLLNLTNCQAEIFNILVKHSAKHSFVTLSQSTIASWIGCCRMTVSRSIKYLISIGLLDVEYRHRQTLIYKVHHSVRLIVHDMFSRKVIPALNLLKFKIINEFFSVIGKKHLEQNVTPYIEDKSINNSHTMVVRQCARAKDNILGVMTQLVDRFKNKSIKTPEKGIEIMNEYAKPTISPLMRHITESLKLTKHGQVRLMIYDEKSLQSAFDNISKALNHRDPFSYFGEHCHGYSVQHGIPIKHELYETMIKRYGISINSPFVIVPVKKLTINTEPKQSNLDFTSEVEHFKHNQERMHPSFAFIYPGLN